MKQSVKSLSWLLTFFLSSFAVSQLAVAQYTDRLTNSPILRIRLDDTQAGSTFGFTGVIEQLNPPGLGYAHFRVRFGTALKTVVPRDVKFDFSIRCQATTRSPPLYRGQVIIEQGQFEGYVDFRLPIARNVYRIDIQTSVDGRSANGLSCMVYDQLYRTESSILILGDKIDFEKIQVDEDLLESAPYQDVMNPAVIPSWAVLVQDVGITRRNAKNSNQYYNNTNNDSLFQFADYRRCSDNILDWTTIRLVAVRLEILPMLSESVAETLRKYIRGGGNLRVVHDLDDATATEKIREWFGLDAKLASDARTAVSMNGLPSETLGNGWFKFGFGWVQLVPETELNDKTLPEYFLPMAAGRSRVEDVKSLSFWDWSLQHLGRPPVLSFCILIGVFAGLVSPVVLRYCLRLGRPVWMLLVFPAMAIVATTSLFSFAVLRDGFRTHLRVRSLTILDQDSDRGVAISRQIMFSGSAPRSGIQFNDDSEVWQIESQEDYRVRNYNGGQVIWNEGQQIYRGLVKSREQFQFVVSQPIDSLRPFSWQKQPPKDAFKLFATTLGDDSCAIRNELNETIKLILINNGDGLFFVGKNLESQKTSSLAAIDSAAAFKLLQQMESSQAMTPPEAMIANNSNNIFSSIFGFGYSSNSYVDMTSTGVYATTIDSLIDDRIFVESPSFYVYIEKGLHIDLLDDSTELEDSLHLVYGQWRHAQ